MAESFLSVADLRAQIAEGRPPSVEELALELVKARAAGADRATVGYLLNLFREAGGCDALSDAALTQWRDRAFQMLADREASKALDVWRRFAGWLLFDPAEGVLRHGSGHPETLAALERVADLWRRELAGETLEIDQRAAAAQALRAFAVSSPDNLPGVAASVISIASDPAMGISPFVVLLASSFLDQVAGEDLALAVRRRRSEKLLELLAEE
jgi:hypothetical protein